MTLALQTTAQTTVQTTVQTTATTDNVAAQAEVTTQSSPTIQAIIDPLVEPLISEPPVGAQSAGPTTVATDNNITDKPGSIKPWTIRLALGVLLLVAAALSYQMTEAGLAPERALYLTVVLAFISSVVAVYEALQILLAKDRFATSLSLFPAAGLLLINLGVFAQVIWPSRELTWISTTSAALAGGAYLILRACIGRANDSHELSRRVLFPGVGELPTIKQGERIALRTGMIVPADVRIETGSCAINERYLSATPRCRVKDEGEVVFAGSEILSGSAEALTLSGTEDSCLRSLERLISPNLERAGAGLFHEDAVARSATAYTLLFIAVSAAISWDERSGIAADVLSAAGLILFSAAVCQLGDLLYVARLAFVKSWARLGFVLTSADSIKELTSVSKVLFDSSRVDLGSVVGVRDLELLDDRLSRTALCSYLSSILGRSDDAALSAAADYCQVFSSQAAPERVLGLLEFDGRGIAGAIKGVEISIGSEEFLVERGILIQPTESALECAANERAILVAIGREVVARFWIRFGQLDITREEEGLWPSNVQPILSSGVSGEVSNDTLLVRGVESDVLGRSAPLQLAFFSGDRFELPLATVVALTPRLDGLKRLLKLSQRHIKLVERARILIAFGAFIAILSVFLGFFSPLVPVLVIPLVALAIFFF